MTSFSTSLHAEYATKGVIVHLVIPGYVATQVSLSNTVFVLNGTSFQSRRKFQCENSLIPKVSVAFSRCLQNPHEEFNSSRKIRMGSTVSYRH